MRNNFTMYGYKVLTIDMKKILFSMVLYETFINIKMNHIKINKIDFHLTSIILTVKLVHVIKPHAVFGGIKSLTFFVKCFK